MLIQDINAREENGDKKVVMQREGNTGPLSSTMSRIPTVLREVLEAVGLLDSMAFYVVGCSPPCPAYIIPMPGMPPPIPGMPPGPLGLSSGASTTHASDVVRRDETEIAEVSDERTTLSGSRIPAATMSV